jgi:hypothetical protein
MRNSLLGVSTLLLVLGVVGIVTAIPPLMNFQGYLTDDAGVPVADGHYTMTFKLYDVPSGGSAVWTETHLDVAVAGGLFNVTLGVDDTLGLSFDVNYWLAVEVDAEELSRVRLTSVGYSYRAQWADRAMRADTADYVLAGPGDDDWTPDTAGLNIYRLTGNVGIGTPSPQERLEVAGNLTLNTGHGIAYVGEVKSSRGDGGLYVRPDSGATLYMGSTNDLTVKNGDVGIGITNPTSRLHVGGGGQTPSQAGEVAYINPDATQVSLCVEENSGVEGGVMSHADGNVYMGSWSDHPVIIRTNNSDRVTVGTNGCVGIGTQSLTTDRRRLHLYHPQEPRLALESGTAPTDSLGRIWDIQNSNSTLEFTAWSPYWSEFTTWMQIDRDGNVGLGDLPGAPEYRLDVEGYVQAHGYYTGDIIFQKDDRKLWRMFEDEDGLYLESLKTGKVYRFVLQEVDKN